MRAGAGVRPPGYLDAVWPDHPRADLVVHAIVAQATWLQGHPWVPHFAKAPPGRPVLAEQAVGVSGSDQIGERHPLEFIGNRSGFLQVPPPLGETTEKGLYVSYALS